MAGFYTALIGTPPTIQWPALSPPCTLDSTLITALATFVTSLAGLVWAFRRKQ